MEFLFWYLISFVFVISFHHMVLDNDSAWWKKRFDKKVWNIGYVCRILNVKEINVENNGFQFGVRMEDKDDYEGIRYYSSPYSTTNIYINDELVCKIHKLKNLFVTYRTLEYAKERNSEEAKEIILKAYKASKKKENEYYKKKTYKEDSNTFYK